MLLYIKMIVQLRPFIFVCVFNIICILGNEDDLPLCPTNINYLPQSLPMHCRMPRSINYPMFPGGLPNFTFPPLPPGFPGPDKAVPQMPFPMPPGMPGPPGPPGLPGAPPMPMHVPMLPMPPPGPAHKVPVIVMPFYSPDGPRKQPHGNPRHTESKKRRIHINKKRLPYYSESDTDTDTGTSETDDSRYTSSDTSSSDTRIGWWDGRRRSGRVGGKRMHKRRRHQSNKDFLTPIIQYVTKDGYVIFEKKISKDQANDWLQEKKGINPREYNDPPKDDNKSKDEEDEALQEYDSATTETARKRSAYTKTMEEFKKIKVRMHKNSHRHPQKAPTDNE